MASSGIAKSGKVILFLGAGASFAGRAAGAAWDPGHITFLPSVRELSQFLATETSFPSSDQAPAAAARG